MKITMCATSVSTEHDYMTGDCDRCGREATLKRVEVGFSGDAMGWPASGHMVCHVCSPCAEAVRAMAMQGLEVPG